MLENAVLENGTLPWETLITKISLGAFVWRFLACAGNYLYRQTKFANLSDVTFSAFVTSVMKKRNIFCGKSAAADGDTAITCRGYVYQARNEGDRSSRSGKYRGRKHLTRVWIAPPVAVVPKGCRRAGSIPRRVEYSDNSKNGKYQLYRTAWLARAIDPLVYVAQKQCRRPLYAAVVTVLKCSLEYKTILL